MKKCLFIAAFLFLIACGEESLDDSQDISSSSLDIAANSSSSNMEHPQMDERVVAYLNKWGDSKDDDEGLCPINVIGRGFCRIGTDIDELKENFQVALNEDNFDPECDYFAIYILQGEILSYYTISKDSSNYLAIYNIHPSLDQPNSPYGNIGAMNCMYHSMIWPHGFLICDKEGGLKDKIMLKFPPIEPYHDPNWFCWGEERQDPDPYFELRK